VITDVSSGVININSSIPEGFILKQNYPNPFNPSTNIEFAIPLKGAVIMKVYDALGNDIQTLVNETLPAGTYSTSFNGDNLATGTYFVRMTSGSITKTKKMMLIK
jgi:hypothetical protein